MRILFFIAVLTASSASAQTWRFDAASPGDACDESGAESLEIARATHIDAGCPAEIVESPNGLVMTASCPNAAPTVLFENKEGCEIFRTFARRQLGL